MSLPAERIGEPAPPELLARRARMPAVWTQEMLTPGATARDATIGGVRCLVCAPDPGRTAVADGTAAILYLHGGGYRLGSPAGWANFASRLAVAAGCRIVVPYYRLAPEHPFPAALHDALAVYRGLIAAGARPPLVGGDSAGGGLAVAVALACRSASAALPGGLILLSPWVDLTVGNPSYLSRPGDLLFPRAAAEEAARQYLQGHAARDPLASPVEGDLTGFPPVLLFASEDECLIDDALALQARLVAARVPVETHLVPGMTHVWPVIAPDLPQSKSAITAIAGFVASWASR